MKTKSRKPTRDQLEAENTMLRHHNGQLNDMIDSMLNKRADWLNNSAKIKKAELLNIMAK